MPHASFILVGRIFSLLCLMCSQSGEGETLLSNFTCHLSPNRFKDEAPAKDFPPFSLSSFFRAFSCPPSCSRCRRSAPGNRGHLNSSAQCCKKKKKKRALEFLLSDVTPTAHICYVPCICSESRERRLNWRQKASSLSRAGGWATSERASRAPQQPFQCSHSLNCSLVAQTRPQTNQLKANKRAHVNAMA